MMRLVTSMMTTEKMSQENINKVVGIMADRYENKIEVHVFKYQDRKYHEVDIDMFNLNFNKKNLYFEINKLIFMYEEILKSISVAVDFIVANDDTDSQILEYEKNSENIGSFGLFVTKRLIPNLKPFYSSDVCNAYVNLAHVSFGVY